MKKLISVKCVEELLTQGQKVVCVDNNTLITPSAQDMIKANDMEISHDTCTQNSCSQPTGKDHGALSSELIYKALTKMSEQGMLNGMFDNCCQPVEKPYQAECDPSGFKLVRGNTVKMEVFETGVPADNGKVQYQELIGADDNSSMNAGFMTVDRCTFDWDVEPQEIYYVVEGTMTVTIDGKPYTACPGDSLFIQKGSKVVFSSGNTKAKVFYATY